LSYCIGIIGGGNMAEAMVSGLISDGYDAARIMVGDINEERLAYLRKNYQVKVTIDNRQIVSSSDVVILALKPSVLEAVLRPLQEMFSKQLVISIAAGITIGKLTECIVGKLPIVRVMPNTPCLIREGISAIAYNDLVSSEQVTIAKDIFSSVGNRYGRKVFKRNYGIKWQRPCICIFNNRGFSRCRSASWPGSKQLVITGYPDGNRRRKDGN